MTRQTQLFFAVLLAWLAEAWVMPGNGKGAHPVSHNHRQTLRTRHHYLMFPAEMNTLLTSVEVFDGNGIIDPVVVSNTFWTTLQSKLIGFIAAQVFAMVIFSLVAVIVAPIVNQAFSTLADKTSRLVSTKIFNDGVNERKKLRIPPSRGGDVKKQADLTKLLVCLMIDIIGSSSELLPVIGEFTDVIYAPIAATVLRSLFGSNIVFALEFAEEILPFADILPLATLCWIVATFAADSQIAQVLQIGDYSPVSSSDESVIDVKSNPERRLDQLKSASKGEKD